MYSYGLHYNFNSPHCLLVQHRKKSHPDPSTRLRHHLHELPPPLEVVPQDKAGRLAHNAGTDAKNDAVAEQRLVELSGKRVKKARQRQDQTAEDGGQSC